MKRPFTLLELAAVVLLLALSASFISLKVIELVSTQSFKGSVENLHTELERLQFLALNADQDMHLHLYRRGDKFYMKPTTMDRKLFVQKEIPLKGIARILSPKQKPIQSIELTFYTDGRIEPAQMLAFHSSTTETYWIDWRVPLLIKKARKPLPRLELPNLEKPEETIQEATKPSIPA